MSKMLHWTLSYHGFDFLVTGTAEHRVDWLEAGGFSVRDAPLHIRPSGDLLDLTLMAQETGPAFSFRVRGTREDLETWRAAGLDVGEIENGLSIRHLPEDLENELAKHGLRTAPLKNSDRLFEVFHRADDGMLYAGTEPMIRSWLHGYATVQEVPR